MSKSEDDEEDYMSDAFLQKESKAPGLMPKIFLNKHKRAEKAKLKAKTKPMKVYAAEKRNEKLNTALDESNKGYGLLMKMGYKSGMGLGKKEQGRSEPIKVEIKEGRKGLGKDAEEQRHKQRKIEANIIRAKRRKIMQANLQEDFQKRMRSKALERQIENDVKKSKIACKDLDTKKNIDAKESWYWPYIHKEIDEETEDVDEHEAEEPELIDQLEDLTDYLQTEHFYCVWCGIKYEDMCDLESHCPGDTYEAHEDLI